MMVVTLNIVCVGATNGVSVDKLEISNCCSLPCNFVSGHNASVTVVFTASEFSRISSSIYNNTTQRHSVNSLD